MKLRVSSRTGSALLLAAALVHPLFSKALPKGNVPKGVALAKDLGPVDPSQPVSLTVVLQVHNQAAYDQAVQALLDPASPTYHQWFKDADFAKYAPTQAEIETVKTALVNQGFTVVSTDPLGLTLRVRGTVANAESAFQTTIHNFSYNGKTFQAHTSDAKLAGAANDLVAAVAGLERHKSTPMLSVAKNPQTSAPLYAVPLSTLGTGSGLPAGVTDVAFANSQTLDFTTGGGLPTEALSGTIYAPSGGTVSYSPQDLQAHYGLTSLIQAGYDGTGETIALVEAFGYANAEADANTFSSMFGLPPLTSSNFSVIYPEGTPTAPDAAELTGWTTEIAMDIQSSHSIAPGASILVVASSGQDNEDQIASLDYIIKKKLANTVSCSWENDDEIIAGSDEIAAFNAVLEKGVAQGISFQFSSGDSGDLGLDTPVGAVGVPSDSPYATAVGGTAFGNNPNGGADIVTGWGHDAVWLTFLAPLDPPLLDGFLGGAGGGSSQVNAKPSWQSSLPGSYRQVPDVSALADPYTGFFLIVTVGSTQYAEAGWGGTSLASPLFTGMWAIANQINGKSLGQAAPAVARLTSSQITDVLPSSPLTPDNVAASITDSNGVTNYTSTSLFSALDYPLTQFTSVLWDLGGDELALSFGTDTSLTVTPGWDNVTGFGEPNGLPFFEGVVDNASASGKLSNLKK